MVGAGLTEEFVRLAREMAVGSTPPPCQRMGCVSDAKWYDAITVGSQSFTVYMCDPCHQKFSKEGY